MPIKIDLHVHSNYSYDSLITAEQLAPYAKRSGIDGVAITDHDRLDGALKIAKESRFLVIPGMEITSVKGHIIGLNVQEPVPRGLSVDETVDKIHKAGGIAIACHPVAFFKGSLGKDTSSKFDAVETINGSAFPFSRSTSEARKLAESLQLPAVGGSDAHYAPEIGYAYTRVEAEPDVDDVVRAIEKGFCQPFGTAIPLRIRLKRVFSVFKRNF